jgi:bifunctional ADP-heptose synthase (sugar kinase/adenylyltransferase)
LFEVYLIQHMEEECPLADEICRSLEAILPEYDLVIVVDYGHGMIVPQAVELLGSKSRFLAVNTQTNADNQGFNTISKYPRADYISLSERELRLEVRSRNRETGSIMKDVAQALDCPTMLVTRGTKGNKLYRPTEGFVNAPSLSNRILDRVGAGDAVFAVTSLCAVQGAPIEVLGFLGNVVGAQAVATVGHRSSIDAGQVCENAAAILAQE